MLRARIHEFADNEAGGAPDLFMVNDWRLV